RASVASVGPPTRGQEGHGPFVARVAPCSLLSRTLRAGYAGAERHPGQHLRAALCRLAGRDEGMVASGRTKESGLQARGHLRGLAIGVVRRLSFERRAQSVEQTIADTAQGARVAVAAPPQRIVTSPGGGIVLNGDARPVMDGVL